MKNNLLIENDIDDSNPEKPSSEFENIFQKLLSGKASHFKLVGTCERTTSYCRDMDLQVSHSLTRSRRFCN